MIVGGRSKKGLLKESRDDEKSRVCCRLVFLFYFSHNMAYLILTIVNTLTLTPLFFLLTRTKGKREGGERGEFGRTDDEWESQRG